MKVAVAIITDDDQRILITQRSLDSPHGGFWEFPGGKVEQGEAVAEALIREVKEEVGLAVTAYDYLGEVCHTYTTEPIQLFVYHIQGFSGDARCCEQQMALKWVHMDELQKFQFPAANLEIIELFKPILQLANG